MRKHINEHTVKLKKRPPKGVPVTLEIGDMMIYRGCDLEHWRNPFKGSVCGQVFLHYNNVNGPFAETNKFDKRPMLGMPPLKKKPCLIFLLLKIT